VKKVALCLLVLAMPSMALGLERRDGAHRCVEEFSRDVSALNQPPFKVNENFVVKLSLTKPPPEEQDDPNSRDRYYRVTITVEGRSSNGCRLDGKPPFVDDDAVLGCDVVGEGKVQYIFNFDNHRFIEIFGSNNDTPHNTPHVARGLCTKISQ
jgi:hypothetical protein